MMIIACRRCGHLGALHEHYRGGTDCAECACPEFLAPRPYCLRSLARLAHRRARAAGEWVFDRVTGRGYWCPDCGHWFNVSHVCGDHGQHQHIYVRKVR